MTVAQMFRQVFGWIRCVVLPHEPNRRRVRKQPSGQHRSYCRHCGVQIRRKAYNEWIAQPWRDEDLL